MEKIYTRWKTPTVEYISSKWNRKEITGPDNIRHEQQRETFRIKYKIVAPVSQLTVAEKGITHKNSIHTKRTQITLIKISTTIL